MFVFEKESYIFQYVQKHEGITYHLYRGRACHRTGYYVSLKDYEETVPLALLTPKVIADYIQNNFSILDLPSAYLGIWVNNGITYLDISRRIRNKKEALGFGKREEQKTIWDCKNQKALEVL